MERVKEAPDISTLRLVVKVLVSQFVVKLHSTLKEQGLHPYHVQKVQALEPIDFPRRVIYCQWLLQRCRKRPNFLNCIMFRNGTEFTRNVVFNSHIFHI